MGIFSFGVLFVFIFLEFCFEKERERIWTGVGGEMGGIWEELEEGEE